MTAPAPQRELFPAALKPHRPAPLALAVYLSLLLALWALSALPLLFRHKLPWSAAPLWYQPPFYDFGCYYERLKLLHHPEFWTSTVGASWDYPAPSIFVYQLFYLFNRPGAVTHQVFFGFLAYLLFAGSALLFAGAKLACALAGRGVRWSFAMPFVAASLLLCWPVYFGLERGNIEFFLDAGIALSLWAYVRRQYWIFAVVLAIFGAGKLYPLLLLSLLLPLRRGKEFITGLATAAAFSVFSAHWIGAAPASGVHSQGILGGIEDWVRANSLNLDLHLSAFDHSIFGFLKLINRASPQHFAAWAIGYAVFGSIGMLLLFFLRLWKLPRPNQLLVIALAAVLLPPTSFDYTLSLLLPAWAWLVLLCSKAAGNSSRAYLIVMCAFAVAFAPEAFAAAHGLVFAGQIKMLFLLVLLAVGALVPFPEEPHLVH